MHWPAAGSAEVSLTPPPAGARAVGPGSGPTAVEAGSLPVSVALTGAGTTGAGASARVKVQVKERTAARRVGVEGLLLSLDRTDAPAGRKAGTRVQVDYSAFRDAYGGDWASRLRLVRLPACALTTPAKDACRVQTPLATTNDTRAGTLSAPVALSGATVLAATAGAEGSSGDYKATSLSASGTWGSGEANGAFSWTYPVEVPAVPGGLQPTISLGYSSQAVDGRTAASNNQPSWIGDGWDWEPGFIERRYKACNDDKTDATNTTRVGDLCWFNDNATLNLGGKSTELVHEDGKGWHLAADSGETVEKLTGAVNGDSGTDGVDGKGEHWKVTTSDGTQYFFGRNRLPGWKDNGTAADDPVTDSAW
ncbi:hypothetical protein ACFWSQ_29405, partial [Streptomyces sp. NPDC058583]